MLFLQVSSVRSFASAVPVAGPSRVAYQALRPARAHRYDIGIPLTPFRPASTASSSRTVAKVSTAPAPPERQPPASPTPRNSARLATPARSVPRPAPEWPYRPSPSSPPGYTDTERTIFARPFEGPFGNRVRMLWFFVPFWGLVAGFYLTTPSVPAELRTPEGVKPIEDESAAVVEAVVADEPKWTITSAFYDYGTPLAMTGVCVFCFVALFSPSRFVTRLTQVRRQAIADPSASAVQELIRVQHGGHLMLWGDGMKGKEVAREDMAIKHYGTKVKSPYLALRIRPKRRISFDTPPYSMDFRDTAQVKATEEEVVLSLSRVEQVFGKVS